MLLISGNCSFPVADLTSSTRQLPASLCHSGEASYVSVHTTKNVDLSSGMESIDSVSQPQPDKADSMKQDCYHSSQPHRTHQTIDEWVELYINTTETVLLQVTSTSNK